MQPHAVLHRPSSPFVQGTGEALCVRVRWGAHRVATHVLSAGQADEDVRLGTSDDAHVVLPRPGRARFRCDGDAFELFFTDGLAGQVLRNGEVPLTLDECIARGLAAESKDGWVMRLGHRDAVRLESGALTVDAFRIRRPRRAVASLDEVLDYRYLNILLVCGLLGAMLLAQASFARVEDALDDGFSRADVTRLRHILVKPPPPPAKAVAANAATSDAPKKGTPTKDGTPKRKPSPPREGGGRSASALVAQALSGLGTQGVFGAGGLGKELSGAMGSMVGASDGLGGMMLRGSGAGGPGGELVGIGGIARPGARVGEGVGALCGAGKSCKKNLVPEPEATEGVVCGGGPCIDKELIRQVIRAHVGQVRYCYEAQLVAHPELAGKVSVTFHVAPSGNVDTARVATSTVSSDALGECLISRVRTWHFPAQRGGGYVVTYPFLFKAAGR
jgi:TonB family protein